MNTTPNTPANGGQILTDERIVELYRESFSAMVGRLREAPTSVPDTVLTFARAIELDLRASLAAPAPKLRVWYGAMPESNGKSNFTAILHAGDIVDGITLDRSEYPDRVRYEADCARHLIGELKERPFILDYDADKRSDFAAPAIPTVDRNALIERAALACESEKVDAETTKSPEDAAYNAAIWHAAAAVRSLKDKSAAPPQPTALTIEQVACMGFDAFRILQGMMPRTYSAKQIADALAASPEVAQPAAQSDEPTDREALIASLEDDAAKLSDANPDDEMAQTMREAAAMLEADEVEMAILGLAAPTPVAGMPDLQRQRDWKLATAVRDWYLANYPQMHRFIEQAPIAELIAALPAPQAPDTPTKQG